MKELIEKKMREAVKAKEEMGEIRVGISRDEIIETCATVSADYFENVWVSVDSGVLPEKNTHALFLTNSGAIFHGFVNVYGEIMSGCMGMYCGKYNNRDGRVIYWKTESGLHEIIDEELGQK